MPADVADTVPLALDVLAEVAAAAGIGVVVIIVGIGVGVGAGFGVGAVIFTTVGIAAIVRGVVAVLAAVAEAVAALFIVLAGAAATAPGLPRQPSLNEPRPHESVDAVLMDQLVDKHEAAPLVGVA